LQDAYRKQVELLIRCLPDVEKQICFALKGGTAINLFVHNMPRLSVNLELVYLPIEPRERTLLNIERSLSEICDSIEQHIAGAKVMKTSKDNHINQLLVKHDGVRIKIEPNIIQRGAIFKVEEKTLCERAESEFELSATANILADAELYGSKLVDALHCQHPCDLFDVKLLLENEGLTEGIRRALVVYLISHPHPMHKLLKPNLKDLEYEYRTQFKGLSNIPILLSDLLETRADVIKTIKNALTTEERHFLISIKSGEPDWTLLDIPQLAQLPGIKWKLQNVRKMGANKRQLSVDKLKNILDIS